MGWFSRLLGRRIASALAEAAKNPEVQAQRDLMDRARVVMKQAAELARSELPDEVACAQLREVLPADPDAINGAVDRLGEQRDNFVDDRAYRLLTAARDHLPVRPIDPAVRDQFREEEALGRLPLAEAFARLAELEPRLLEAPPPEPRRPRGFGIHVSFHPGASALDFVGWQAEHPLLRTDLAYAVVGEYLKAKARGRPLDSTPFFQRPRTFSHGTFFSVGLPDKPVARN